MCLSAAKSRHPYIGLPYIARPAGVGRNPGIETAEERTAMAEDTERKIAERAYQIWDEEGRPLGRDKEHWAQARRDLRLSDLHSLQPEPTKFKDGSVDQLERQLLAEGKLDAGAIG
jgi:hypothetical protein